MTDKNECCFEGYILNEPELIQVNDTHMLDLVIVNKPYPNNNTEVIINLRIFNIMAIQTLPLISKGDRIMAFCSYSPSKVLHLNNIILPKFNVSRLIITEKKLSKFQIDFK